MFHELHTERLYLKEMTLKDAPDLFQIWKDPKVAEYMNISPFTEERQARDMVVFLSELAQKGQAVRFSIIQKSDGRVIGSCGYNYIDTENEKAEIGYDLASLFWGRGYATEAIESLLDYAFDELHLNRIEAKVAPFNARSIKLLRKLAFTYEGTLRETEKIQGEFVDLAMYSKLKKD